MQFHTCSLPNNSHSTAIMTPHSHFSTDHKSVFGFHNSPKTVLRSRTDLGNHGRPVISTMSNAILSEGLRSGLSASRNGLRRNCGWIGARCEVFSTENGDYDDGYYIRKCVEIAMKAIGHTSPNPMVGCVIVKDGTIVGEGFHPKAGLPHAEVFALREAGELAENATAYVSLEPCKHHGRTPPCTEALIKAKVKKVVVGMVDPNPIVASKGVDRLRKAGINVTVGVEEQLCKKLNEVYIHQMLTGKPFVTLRYSLSINGCLLDQLGEGATESGGYYSKLLQECDGIILSPTSVSEKPLSPTSQEPGANQPVQILIAKKNRPSIQVPDIATESGSKLIILTEKEASAAPETYVVLEKISSSSVLDYCTRRGLCNVLVDLRGDLGDLEELLYGCLDHNLLQKVVIEVLPLWLGTKAGKSLTQLQGKLKLKILNSKASKCSVILEAVAEPRGGWHGLKPPFNDENPHSYR